MTRLPKALLALLPLSWACAQEISFNRDIRPIMSDTCFRCHGHDAGSRMANMRLDIREEALKAKKNGTPIVPGEPDRSEIVQRVFATDARIMPPTYANKKLTHAQKETIRRWVAQGAKYEGHWAYQPVSRPSVPVIATGTANPIDAFIQARLAAEGLKPSPEADRRTLLRRVTLDLTGLAPTPEQLAAFQADQSPDAYQKVVDQLLATPAYAEKRAVRWLDAVRYADTAGYHSDGERPAWLYRDYVLRSFRNNKPFDAFTRQQLAGDLMPNPSVEDKIASAYNRMGRTSGEGGVQPKEYLAKYGAERARAVSANWLGATMGCAECHDHKFDPILTKDFYSMKAFFADIQETGLIPDVGPDAFAPKMAVYQPGEKERLEELENRIQRAQAALDAQADSMRDARRQWEQALSTQAKAGKLTWQFPLPIAVSATKAKLTIDAKGPETSDDQSNPLVPKTGGSGMVMAEGANPDNETYTVTLRPGPGMWTSLALEIDNDPALPGADLSRGSDRFVISEVDAAFSKDGAQHGAKTPFNLAYSTIHSSVGFPAMAVLDNNPKTGFGIVGAAKQPMLILRFADPLRTVAASTLTVRIHQDSDYRQATIGRFRLGLSSGTYSWAANTLPQKDSEEEPQSKWSGIPSSLMRALDRKEEKRSAEQLATIRDYFEYSAPELAAAKLQIVKLETELSYRKGAVAQVMITESVTPRETRILPRGNWMDDSGQVVEPAIPEFLGRLNINGQRATRLDLANWLVSSQNPLTARVYMNRIWSEFFGVGISKALEDLGSQGEWPSHLELLDWLASEFMEPKYDSAGAHAWDVRHMVRTIVLSQTYRQSSLSSPELDQRDPENRLLARQSRLRVDAESVHDVMLEISGLLVDRFGGPSVRPYQPEGYLAALNFPKRAWSASRNDNLYRRGIYTFWQRTFLQPTMANFDAPTREECTVNRMNSNTPLQALDLLNDATFVEAARVFGERILTQPGMDTNRKIEWAFQQATGRRPDSDELKLLAGLHRQSLAHFKAEPEAAGSLLSIGDAPVPPNTRPAELAAMSNVARVIMNLHEVITRD